MRARHPQQRWLRGSPQPRLGPLDLRARAGHLAEGVFVSSRSPLALQHRLQREPAPGRARFIQPAPHPADVGTRRSRESTASQVRSSRHRVVGRVGSRPPRDPAHRAALRVQCAAAFPARHGAHHVAPVLGLYVGAQRDPHRVQVACTGGLQRLDGPQRTPGSRCSAHSWRSRPARGGQVRIRFGCSSRGRAGRIPAPVGGARADQRRHAGHSGAAWASCAERSARTNGPPAARAALVQRRCAPSSVRRSR